MDGREGEEYLRGLVEKEKEEFSGWEEKEKEELSGGLGREYVR